VVHLLYHLFPDSTKGKYTQKQYANHIKQAVDSLLQNGAFMHNGTDDEVSMIVSATTVSHACIVIQGHTNNLTHPAVAELCRLFLYAADNRLGHLFPDVFGSEVPAMTVALIITAVCLAMFSWPV
jgi:hypothetical protein